MVLRILLLNKSKNTAIKIYIHVIIILPFIHEIKEIIPRLKLINIKKIGIDDLFTK
jgi:hypothetical protein